MPPRKVDVRFIENARSRAARYAKRSRGLQKKASELSTLCGVPVALVCSPATPGAAGAVAPLVWESEEGVLERYRAAAVPPDARARHTHRSYLEAELGKERAKLARARPGALPDWDPALNDMAPDEAREVLEAIDAALQAARDRMAALGLPADGRLALELVAVPGDDDDASASDDAPQHLALDMGTGYAGYQTQTMPCHGGSNDRGGQLEQFLMQPERGLVCVDGGGGSSSYLGPVDGTQAPGGYGDNAGYTWPDLTMCYPAHGSWNAPMPVGYYPYFANGALAPEHYSSAQDLTGGDYADTLPLEHTMGMDENFAYPHMDNTYAAHWQAQDFQRSDTGTSQYHGTRGSGQAFHYLY
ncbi:hypothetical protein QYE76_020313 [Lolium multiflorum]|uniref:MADS-box domain-containing protein n=1 Tax=Lolium multiflorum TaxID=4521 RepID=A0AAD8VR76_LOLMU|nr:hypothetical protein QYE76_020313 [Lolium multiflorum]